MITTGLHIPKATRRHLTSTIARIHKETTELTIGAIREHFGDLDSGSLPYIFHVSLGKHGTVQAIEPTLCPGGIDEEGPDFFEIDVPLFGAPKNISVQKSWVLADFLMKRELNRRISMGLREMISLSDTELSQIIDKLSPAFAHPFHAIYLCGELSELFKLRMAKIELETRGNESSHRRIKYIEANEPFLKASKRMIEQEKAAAWEWMDARLARGSGLYLSYQFLSLPEEDRVLIGYRNQKGW